MPFDDLKTLPERFVATPTTQTPVKWAVTGSPQGLVHLCDSYELADRVAGTERLATGKDYRIRPLVYGDRPSGVAAAAATAADVSRSVAETPEMRQVDQSCRGERQKPAKPVEIDGDRPDVGEGWREIRTGEHAEHLAEGDWVQDSNGCWEPIHGFMVGGFGSPSHRYRRRVTPAESAEEPQNLKHVAGGVGLRPSDEWDDTDRVMVLLAVLAVPAALLAYAVLRVVVVPLIFQWIIGR
jgi:hypothetical protein